MRTAIIAMTAALSFPALAEEPAAGDADRPEDGEQEVTVVVTAAKHGQKITEAPAAVTVITAEDIAASGVSNVAELFRRVPGLDFIQTGARDINVNARGFNNLLSRRLLVLVDGRSVYLTILGFVLWDGIQVTLDDIERIEVVRGPGSALYGANASSGVVNIITKAPKDVDGTCLMAGVGELGTREARVLSGYARGDVGFKVAASYYETEPFDNPDRDADSQFQREGEPATKQPKGYARFEHANLRGGRLTVDAGYGSTQGTLYTAIGPLDVLPGSYAPFARVAYARGGLFLHLYWNEMVSDTLNLTSLQKNYFTTDSYHLEGQWGKEIGSRHFLVAGGELKWSDIASDLTARSEVEVYAGVYLQDEIRIADRWTATAALRVDHDELVGAVVAPKAAILFAPTPRHSFRLSAATAYNSSSLIESYLDFGVTPFPENPEFIVYARGNPDLEPERIESYEVGYRAFPVRGLLLDVNLFHARLHDFIQFLVVEEYAPGVPKAYAFVNGGEATETGIELSAEWAHGSGLSLSGSYAYTDVTQDESITDVTARNKASATIQYGRPRGASGSLTAVYADELAFDLETPFYQTGTVPSYTVVNGSASYRFGADGRFHVALQGTNLLDKRHREFIAGDILERKLVLAVGARF